MFDIVVAKTYRPLAENGPGFYLRGLFEEFRERLNSGGSRFSAIDNMTLLQALAVIVRENFEGSGVQNITDHYLNVLRTEHLEAVWEDGMQAIRKVFGFLDNHLHLPGPALVPYRYFYMTLASYFFQNPHPDYSFLSRYFWYFSFHNDDLLSNTTHLRDHLRRLNDVRTGRYFGFERFLIDRENLRRTAYSTRGRLSRAMLSLYAYQGPCDWAHPDRSVLTQVYYTLTDHPNLHHIFPSNFCEKHLGDQGRHADSLLNIAYLTQITNRQISNRNPLEYLRDYLGSQCDEVQRTHLLPDLIVEWARAEQMPHDALDTFLDARLDLVIDQLRSYLPDIPFEVIDTRTQEIHRRENSAS